MGNIPNDVLMYWNEIPAFPTSNRSSIGNRLELLNRQINGTDPDDDGKYCKWRAGQKRTTHTVEVSPPISPMHVSVNNCRVRLAKVIASNKIKKDVAYINQKISRYDNKSVTKRKLRFSSLTSSDSTEQSPTSDSDNGVKQKRYFNKRFSSRSSTSDSDNAVKQKRYFNKRFSSHSPTSDSDNAVKQKRQRLSRQRSTSQSDLNNSVKKRHCKRFSPTSDSDDAVIKQKRHFNKRFSFQRPTSDSGNAVKQKSQRLSRQRSTSQSDLNNTVKKRHLERFSPTSDSDNAVKNILSNDFASGSKNGRLRYSKGPSQTYRKKPLLRNFSINLPRMVCPLMLAKPSSPTLSLSSSTPSLEDSSWNSISSSSYSSYLDLDINSSLESVLLID